MNKIRSRFILLPLLGCLLAPFALRADPTPIPAPAPTRVACVGDSITYGAGLKDRRNDSYPAWLGRWLGTNWEVRNFGVSGATLLTKANRPYVKRKECGEALDFKPDILIIMLGTNDSKHPTAADNAGDIPDNWQYKGDYVADYEALIAQFRKANPAVKVYVCYPTPCFPGFGGINDDTIHHEIIPLIQQVAKDTKANIIDLYDAMAPHKDLFIDTVHPTAAGAKLMAADVYLSLTGKDAPDHE
jgi:lysophospholipase L1-like esterase